MSRILRAAGAAVLALALFAPTAAHGDRWTGADESGDVAGSHYDPEPKPCGTDTDVDGSAETNNDVVAVGVRHSRRAMVITTRYQDLDPEQSLTQWLYVRTAAGGYWIVVDRAQTRSGKWRVFAFMTAEPKLPDPEDIDDECGVVVIGLIGQPCRLTREFDFERERTRIAVPRRCLGNPRWVRVGVAAYRFIDSEDPDDASSTSFSDEWDGGADLSPWAAPYGPRVHATAGAPTGGAKTDTWRSQERHFVVRRDGIFARR